MELNSDGRDVCEGLNPHHCVLLSRLESVSMELNSDGRDVCEGLNPHHCVLLSRLESVSMELNSMAETYVKDLTLTIVYC